MKKFIIAALAASIAVTPAMAAPFQHNGGHGRVIQNHRVVQNHRAVRPAQYRAHWKKGERFDYRQARNYRVVTNYRQYHLREAPRGYRWVQSGNDAVLIGITSGIIASVLAGAFH